MADTFLKPLQKIYTTYHLWDKWSIDVNSDGVQTLAIDEHDQVMLYAPLKRLYRNKGVVSALFRHDNGGEQVILLDPHLEASESIEIPLE